MKPIPNLPIFTSVILVYMFKVGPSCSLVVESDCEKTKSCFRGSVTTTIATWHLVQPQNTTVHFELQAKTNQYEGKIYVALGLSFDDYMASTAVTACVTDGTSVGMGLWFNSDAIHANSRIQNFQTVGSKIINNFKGELTDGTLYCSYDQLIDIDSSVSTQMRTLNNSYKLILIMGPGVYDAADYSSTGGHHSCTPDCLPKITSQKVNPSAASFSSVTGSTNNTQTILSHLHVSALENAFIFEGILMAIAWFLCHAIAIMSARFFRGIFPKIKPGNKDLWFHGHRILNVVGLVLVITATVLIVVAQKRWIGNDAYPIGTHGAVGVATIVSAIVQPFAALFRPHPGTKHRWIFNYLHRTVGLSSYALAAATIYLATEIISGDIGGRMKTVLYIYWGAVAVTFLILEGHVTVTQRIKPTTISVEDHLNGAAPKNTIKMPHVRTATLLIFILIALGLAATFIVYVIQHLNLSIL